MDRPGARSGAAIRGRMRDFYAAGDRAPAQISVAEVLGRRLFVSLQTSERIWARCASRTGSFVSYSGEEKTRERHRIFVLGLGAILPGEKIPLDLNGRHIISAAQIFSAIFSRPWPRNSSRPVDPE